MQDDAFAMSRKFTIDPEKPFFIYDTAGDWQATKFGSALFDTRGEYIGFVRGETYDVYTASGEWIGALSHDGRIIRKRNAPRLPLVTDIPPKAPKPTRLPARAPLPPQTGDLGFDKIDVLEWDPEVFKRLSDLTPDKE
jgi:hypothetical protein